MFKMGVAFGLLVLAVALSPILLALVGVLLGIKFQISLVKTLWGQVRG